MHGAFDQPALEHVHRGQLELTDAHHPPVHFEH
jgi:hypothetical protein